MATQPPIPPTPPHPKTHRLPARRPSMYVEISLQIRLFFAKRTQFPQRQNQRNPFYHKQLYQYSAPLRPKKRTQSNPNEPNFKMGKMNISTVIIKAYASEQ